MKVLAAQRVLQVRDGKGDQGPSIFAICSVGWGKLHLLSALQNPWWHACHCSAVHSKAGRCIACTGCLL